MSAIPYINTTLKFDQDVGLNTLTDRRFEIYVGRVEWISVSFTANQALNIINSVLHPPGNQLVKMSDGSKELQPVWQIFKIKHGNGVHPGWIGVRRTEDGLCEVGIKLGCFATKTLKPGIRELFWTDAAIVLTRRQAKILVGYIMHWAGAVLIGQKSKTVHKKVKYLPGVNEKST